MRISSAPLPQTFADFLAHWTALRGTARAPALSDFLDKPIPSLQPWISIFDVGGDDLTLRLIGTGIAQFGGTDHTGKTFGDLVAPEARAVLHGPHLGIVQKCCGSFTVSLCATSRGREVEIWALGLPLLRRDGACVAWLNEPGEALGIGETGTVILRMVSQQWIDLGDGVPG
jgi:hypothetical protein